MSKPPPPKAPVTLPVMYRDGGRVSGLRIFIFVLICVVPAVAFTAGYHMGKEQGCDRVGFASGEFRTDSHVYRVCR